MILWIVWLTVGGILYALILEELKANEALNSPLRHILAFLLVLFLWPIGLAALLHWWLKGRL